MRIKLDRTVGSGAHSRAHVQADMGSAAQDIRFVPVSIQMVLGDWFYTRNHLFTASVQLYGLHTNLNGLRGQILQGLR